MRAIWSLLVSLALVLGLGLSQAPRPCLGDRHGHACSLASCQCDGTCTCKLDHEHEAEARALAEAAVCGDTSHAVVSCHHGAHGANFAAPMKHWTALLPVGPAPLAWARLPLHTPAAARPALTAGVPPFKPPQASLSRA